MTTSAIERTAVLLPGENPESTYAEDIRHWIGVYEQLIDFCEQIPRGRRSHPMQAQLGRLRGRLAYWRVREGQL